MPTRTDADRWHDIRLIDSRGVFHVHHHGDKASARERARRMAAYHWPREDGYTLKGTGQASDCISAFKGTVHQGDVAIEPLDAPAE